MTHLSCSGTREAKGTPLAGTRFGCSQLDKCCCHFSLGRKTDSSTEETKPLFDIIMVLKEFCPLANLAGNWTISDINRPGTGEAGDQSTGKAGAQSVSPFPARRGGGQPSTQRAQRGLDQR